MSTNRLFNTIIIVALVVVLGLTIREGLATSSVVRANPESAAVAEQERVERALSADTARWNAQAETYLSVEGLDAQRTLRSQQAAADRLRALAGSYGAIQERARMAEIERWKALVKYYLEK